MFLIIKRRQSKYSRKILLIINCLMTAFALKTLGPGVSSLSALEITGRKLKMPKSNIADAYKVQQRMMTLSALWPIENEGFFYMFIRYSTAYAVSGALCITMLFQIAHVINDFTELSEILYIMVSIASTLIKQAGFRYRKKDFLSLIEFLKNPIFASYPDYLDHYMVTTIKYSTFIANCYQYLIVCSLSMFGIYPFFDNKLVPFPFAFPLNAYTRIVMFILQLAGASCCAWNNSCMDVLCASLMGVAAAQLDILSGKIIHIKEKSDKETEEEADRRIIETLKQCAEHHLAIINFIDQIEDIFSFGILVQFVTSALVICNTLFHFVLIEMSSQVFMLALYFTVMVMELCIYCWYGNEIIVKSFQVGEACYKFNWYKCGNEVRKYLFLIMERSKRPLVITTMSFAKLSLVTLTSILQWSYSCLALLMKMYQKRLN